MSAEPSPKPNPMAAFQSLWYRFALVFFVTYLTVFWFVLGPSNPWYALMVVWGTSSLEPVVATALCDVCLANGSACLRASAYFTASSASEFSVGCSMSPDGIDVIKPLRGFSGKKSGLLSLEQSARAGAIAHGVCFAIHVLLAVLALFTRHPWRGALWMLLPGVVVHLYPVLLQRSIMLRVQPLLDKTGSC